MAVKIRLKRMGRKKKPLYRVVVADERSPREGLEATLGAIGRSDINAFSPVDPERARKAADEAAKPMYSNTPSQVT